MNKEILEGNKLIVEFMEIKPTEWKGMYLISQHNHTCLEDTPEKALSRFASITKYHESWDWLMPVVERIDSRTPYDPCVTIEYNWCSIKVPDGRFDIEIIGGSRIEATYKAVLEFIKWYNKNKNK
jgi:hypothetical protein